VKGRRGLPKFPHYGLFSSFLLFVHFARTSDFPDSLSSSTVTLCSSFPRKETVIHIHVNKRCNYGFPTVNRSISFLLLVGWDHVCGTATSVGPIDHPPGDGWMNMEYRWNGICHGIAEALSKEPVRMPLCLRQTIHALSCERTRVCTARTCFTAGPLKHQSLQMKNLHYVSN
jgi:hypothetical protein